MKRIRLDEILIKRGWAEDKKEAFVVVTEGRVLVNGQKAVSPAMLIESNAEIEIRKGPLYVGRGAYKLEAAIKKFGIDIKGAICADIGAATGGFTQVLLLHGARKVYAIDTARGKLAQKIRENPGVIVMEETDVRDIKKLPETVDIITADVSLISLRDILPHLRRFLPRTFSGQGNMGAERSSERVRGLKEKGEVIALFKPQYETRLRGRSHFGEAKARDPKILKHGIVRDDAAREKLLKEFLVWAGKNNWKAVDWIESPIRGDKGNVEYLLWLRLS